MQAPTKSSAELSTIQVSTANARALKLGGTQRLSKQLSLGANNFQTKVSTKSIVRMSENSLSSKSKTLMSMTTRGGSIPKMVAKEAREFGREIN